MPWPTTGEDMKRTKQSTFAKRERREQSTGFAPVGGEDMTHTAKHTPGPWEVTGSHSREVIATNRGNYRPCMTIAKVGGYWDGEAQANAHLIAAAPAMYAELVAGLVLLEASYQDMCGKYGTDSLHAQTVWERVERTRQVIAQAEGK